jgi:AraC-like DNA-binding protein/quercetin dioxygenase-like cupin family protein
MPRNRQTEDPARRFRAAEIDDVPRPVVAYAYDYPAGTLIDRHAHERVQLVHAIAGVMTVETGTGIWVVPPGRALWMPAGQDHAIRADGVLSMRSLYIAPDAVPALAPDCRVVDVPPLVRELILASLALPRLYDPAGADGRLIAVLLDRIADLPQAGLHLPLPHDRRLRPIVDAIVADPGDRRPLADWAAVCGAGDRTLARLFVRETGMTFAAWRRQAALQRALAWLAEGRPVTAIAIDLGYDSPSAFIAMFKRALGTTPGLYMEDGSPNPS